MCLRLNPFSQFFFHAIYGLCVWWLWEYVDFILLSSSNRGHTKVLTNSLEKSKQKHCTYLQKHCKIDTFSISFLHTFIQHIFPYLFQNFLKYPCIKIEDLESRLKLNRVSQHSMKIHDIIAKNNILWLSQNPGPILISLLRASTVPNVKALAWKKRPQEWRKCKNQ